MAILSNINGKFAVDSTGAIQLSGSAGTANYVLVSGGAGGAASWIDGSSTVIIGGPYLPLSGGTLTGATATSTGISFTVGGVLTVNGGGIDIDNNDDIRLRFDNASVFKAGLQVATTASDMIAGSAVNDFCIRTQENMLFSTGGNVERMRIDSSGQVIIKGNTDNSAEFLTVDDADPTLGSQRPHIKFTGAGTQLGKIRVLDNGTGMQFLNSTDSIKLTISDAGTATFADKINAGGRILTEATTSNALLQVKYNASNYLEAYYYGLNVVGGSFLIQTGGTTALTLSSSQNATFAGSAEASNFIILDGTSNYIQFDLNGKNSHFTSQSKSYIWSGQGASGDYLAGTLNFQSRSSLDRDINFITGATPAIRLTISGSGNATFTGSVTTTSVITPTVTTATNTSLFLKPNGSGHVYLGDSGNGTNFYHYSAANDGKYTTYDFSGGYYRIATTATSGVKIDDPLYVSGNATFAGDVTISKSNTAQLQLIDTTNNVILLQGCDDTNAFIRSYVGPILLQTNGGTTALTLDSSQNATFAGKILAGTGATAAATINAYTATVSAGLYSALRVIENSGASSYWDIGATGGGSPDLNFYVNGGTTPKLTIDGSGNVGIGTDSPSSKLVVRTSTDHNFEVEETGGELRLSALNNARSANIGLQFAASEFNFLTGNVGIGTTSPTQAKLCIDGTQNSIYLTRGGASDTKWTISSDSVSMYIGEAVGGNIMTLREDGHVGIGTTGPSSPLHVTAAPANGVYLSYLYNSGTHNSSHGLNIQTATSNIAAYGLRVNTGGDSNALAVMGNGSVGIGIAAPVTKLDVYQGDIRRSGIVSGGYIELGSLPGYSANAYQSLTSGGTIHFSNNAKYCAYLEGADTYFGILNSSSVTKISLNTNGNTYFNGGNVGIGLTAPTGRLHIEPVGNTTVGIKIEGSSLSSVENILSWNNQAAGTGWYHLVAQSSGGNAIIIYGNGNIQNANNSYGQISDINLKENITDATPKLEDIKKLKVKNFNFKGDDLKQIGMIAQDVEEVFPGLVEEVTDPKTKEKHKSLKYSVFVPMLIKSIQELEARVKELENK